MKKILGIIILALILQSNNWFLYAGDNDFGHWGTYGVKAEINDVWFFSSDVELRFRDNTSDFHYFRWEFGPGIKFNKYFSILVMYRLNPQEKKGEWKSQHYMMIDPSFKIYSSAKWAFDIRSRFKVKLADLGRGFWRPKPQLSYKFKIGESKSSWFVNNEFFVQMTELGARDRINQNRFATGFKFGLGKYVDLRTYYLLRSDKESSTSDWNNIHVIGSSLYFKF